MRNIFPKASAACVLFFLAFSLTGCKGRTADNMKPTGDTVEVKVLDHDDQITPLPDSIAVPE